MGLADQRKQRKRLNHSGKCNFSFKKTWQLWCVQLTKKEAGLIVLKWVCAQCFRLYRSQFIYTQCRENQIPLMQLIPCMCNPFYTTLSHGYDIQETRLGFFFFYICMAGFVLLHERLTLYIVMYSDFTLTHNDVAPTWLLASGKANWFFKGTGGEPAKHWHKHQHQTSTWFLLGGKMSTRGTEQHCVFSTLIYHKNPWVLTFLSPYQICGMTLIIKFFNVDKVKHGVGVRNVIMVYLVPEKSFENKITHRGTHI